MHQEIVAVGLSRSFRQQRRARAGLWGRLRDLLQPVAEARLALDNVSFTFTPGETVGLIGPNGAGKSTTIKLLTGLLRPTSGQLRVGGLDPWASRQAHVRRLGVVFGHKTQLWNELSVSESFELLAAMFGVSAPVYRERLKWLDQVLEVRALLDRPVRQLSLGERVRCDLAAALLHDPPFLFLDEPTIGLDVAVRLRLRQFLKELRDRGQTTLLLTSHDLADVTALCPRVLLVAEGRLLHDGPMEALIAKLGGRRHLRVQLSEGVDAGRVAAGPWPAGVQATVAGAVLSLSFAAPVTAPALMRQVLTQLDIVDLRLEEPAIEELVARFYEQR